MVTVQNSSQPDFGELAKQLGEVAKALAAAHPAPVQPSKKPLQETDWPEADRAVQAIDKAIDTANDPNSECEVRVDLIVVAIKAVTGLKPNPENQLRFRLVDARLRKELLQMFPDESAEAAKIVNKKKG